jgi:hypothetical protein
MKRSIKYQGIKEVIYTLDQFELYQAVMKFIETEHSDLFVNSEEPSKYSYEWGERDSGAVYLEIKQTMVESEHDTDAVIKP